MPDTETLGIVTINYNTIERKEVDSPKNCKTNMSQENDATEKCYTNTVSEFENEDKQWLLIMITISKYFLPGTNSDKDKRLSTAITQQLQREFKDVFNGIRCFNGKFSLQVKPDSKQYQAPPRCVTYALQQPFKEVEHLQ